MERSAWAIHYILRDLEELPGALIPGPNNEQSDGSRHGMNPAAEHSRALRRLDRALKVLEEGNQQQVQHNEHFHGQNSENYLNVGPEHGAQQHVDQDPSQTQDDSNMIRTPTLSQPDGITSRSSCDESRNCRPDVQGSQTSNCENAFAAPLMNTELLEADLRAILTRLAVPMNQPEDTKGIGKLAASILKRIAKLWIAYSMYNVELLPAGDVICLLHRLLKCCDEAPDYNGSDSNSLFWMASSAWLGVLNTHFIRMDDDRRVDEIELVQQAIPSIFGTYSTLPSRVVVQLLPRFLSTSLEMVQLTPWDPKAVGDAITETRMQWRILTGYLIAHTIQLQQDEFELAQERSAWLPPEQWLHDRLRETNPSVPSYVIMGDVHDLFLALASYVTELTDYALDALDGAAVFFSSTTTPLTGLPRPAVAFAANTSDPSVCASEEREAGVAAMALESAEAAMHDSLRHVTLATTVLVAVFPWCGQASEQAALDTTSPAHHLRQIQQEQLVSLWKTMAASFMAKSNVSTVLNTHTPHDVAHGNDLASRICDHQLQLADLVLSPSLSHHTISTASGYESTLTLTILRALDFPNQLLQATFLWDAVAQRIQQCQQDRSHMDLKRTLQAAVLTLRQQHMLHAAQGSSMKQQGAQAIVDRLLPLLLNAPSNGTHQQGPRTTKARQLDPWDGFFLRQIGSNTMARSS